MEGSVIGTVIQTFRKWKALVCVTVFFHKEQRAVVPCLLSF